MLSATIPPLAGRMQDGDTSRPGDFALRQGIQATLQHRGRTVDIDGGGVEVDGDDVALLDRRDGATGLGFRSYAAKVLKSEIVYTLEVG